MLLVIYGNDPLCVSTHPCFIFFKGTTERIFEEKKELYDVYIDNQNVKTHRSHLQPLLRLNAADKEKYRKLTEQRYTTHCKPGKIACFLSNDLILFRENQRPKDPEAMIDWLYFFFISRQMLLYNQEVDGDCTSTEEDLFILWVLGKHTCSCCLSHSHRWYCWCYNCEKMRRTIAWQSCF